MFGVSLVQMSISAHDSALPDHSFACHKTQKRFASLPLPLVAASVVAALVRWLWTIIRIIFELHCNA